MSGEPGPASTERRFDISDLREPDHTMAAHAKFEIVVWRGEAKSQPLYSARTGEIHTVDTLTVYLVVNGADVVAGLRVDIPVRYNR